MALNGRGTVPGRNSFHESSFDYALKVRRRSGPDEIALGGGKFEELVTETRARHNRNAFQRGFRL
jgi:hypothetical protein